MNICMIVMTTLPNNNKWSSLAHDLMQSSTKLIERFFLLFVFFILLVLHGLFFKYSLLVESSDADQSQYLSRSKMDFSKSKFGTTVLLLLMMSRIKKNILSVFTEMRML